MKTRTAKYIIQEDRGLIKRSGRNAIIVTDENAPAPFEFDSFEQTARHIAKRRLKPIEEVQVKTESGKIDSEATEQAIETHYVEHFQRLMDLAVDFTAGMTVQRGQPNPVRYNGKLYDVIQEHTTQSDWTPDLTPALFRLIQEPTSSGYPEWVQPDSTNPYMAGDRVTYNGRIYKSTIDDNVWSPDSYPQGWKDLRAV